jgi:hypothetical protein
LPGVGKGGGDGGAVVVDGATVVLVEVVVGASVVVVTLEGGVVEVEVVEFGDTVVLSSINSLIQFIAPKQHITTNRLEINPL